MIRLILILLIIFPFRIFGQSDTTFYYGVNGQISNSENAIVKKEIDYRSKNKRFVDTYKFFQEKWHIIQSEKIKILNDSTFLLKIDGEEFSGKIVRKIQSIETENYKFTDWKGERIKRIGETKTIFPLCFDGEVTDFYANGKIRSISKYDNNELLTCKYWLPDTVDYFDSIFFSVDNEPLFKPGLGNMHSQILEKIIESKYDINSVEGQIVVGLIILQTGEMVGVHLVKGLVPSLNKVVVDAVKSVKGDWAPARLNGKNVN